MGREAIRQARIKIARAVRVDKAPKIGLSNYQKYLLGNSWRCPDAPLNPAIPLQVRYDTGAHHWLEFKAGKPGEFYCRHCFEIRKFDLYGRNGHANKARQL